MLDKYYTATGPANIVGIDLHTIWNVRADASYRFEHDQSFGISQQLHQHGGTGLICIRTLGGHGMVVLTSGRQLALLADSLLLIRWEELSSYFCLRDHWDFWWFEFTVSGPLHIPLNSVINVTPIEDELALIRRAFSSMRKPQFTQRCLASVAVTELLYQWIAHSELPGEASPYYGKIEHAIEMLHTRMTPPWTVREMASEANMSERNFRRIFLDMTGQSPKRFYHYLRLSYARQLLRHSSTISEVADRLGFSSQYHFSREFKRFVGIPPSWTKKQRQ